MTINGESCILVLPRDNTTFYLISVKPFNIPDIETEIDPLEPEYNSQETESKENIIIIDTLSTVPLIYNRGRSRKNTNITVFLQDNIQYKDSR